MPPLAPNVYPRIVAHGAWGFTTVALKSNKATLVHGGRTSQVRDRGG